MMNKTQIFGDGNKCVIFTQDHLGYQMAYELTQPILRSISLDLSQAGYPLRLLGNTDISEVEFSGIMDISLDIQVEANNVVQKYSTNGDLFLDLDVFKNISVSKMFKIINAKLNKRDQGDD